jgi:hypothetical protein
LAAHLCYVFTAKLFGMDYQIFWSAGRTVWAGRDPYAPDEFAAHPFLNPPTALPVFAAFALLPVNCGCALWTMANVSAVLALAGLAQRTLSIQQDGGTPAASDDQETGRLSAWALAGLTAGLIVSDAALTTFYLGQFSILTTVAILAALTAQGQGKPIVAGLWLALATIKVTTMLPFLLLFHRKSDRLTWLSLGLAVGALCLATGAPASLPGRLEAMLKHIKELQAPGQVNDYTFGGTQPETILGFEHALYRLGLRNPDAIRIGQYAILIVLGVGLARQVVWIKSVSRAAACSLVALYSVLFLYHRGYDTLILVLPLVYSTGRAQSTSGMVRLWFIGCAVAILLILYLSKGFLHRVQMEVAGWGGWGRLAQAAVLPYGTWLILGVMLALTFAVSRRS